MKCVRWVGVLGIALFIGACGPSVSVVNNVAHPQINPPPRSTLKVSLWYQLGEIGRVEGENVRILHNPSGIYFGLSSHYGVGGGVSVSNMYIFPSLFLKKTFGEDGLMITTQLTYYHKKALLPLMLGLTLFHYEEKGQVFLGVRTGTTFNKAQLQYKSTYDSQIFRCNSREGFIGFEGELTKWFSFHSVFSFGYYGSGIYSYTFDEDTIPRFSPITYGFTQIQLGFNLKF